LEECVELCAQTPDCTSAHYGFGPKYAGSYCCLFGLFGGDEECDGGSVADADPDNTTKVIACQPRRRLLATASTFRIITSDAALPPSPEGRHLQFAEGAEGCPEGSGLNCECNVLSIQTGLHMPVQAEYLITTWNEYTVDWSPRQICEKRLFEAFGIAFGWSSLFEMVATALVLFPLMAIGYVKAKERFNMIDTVTEGGLDPELEKRLSKLQKGIARTKTQLSIADRPPLLQLE
jgi:hypothetical protein